MQTSSRDLAKADVYFLCREESAELVEDALNRAAGFIHNQMYSRLSLRRVPQLFFKHDNAFALGAQMSSRLGEGME